MPGGLTLLASTNAAIPTPAAGKVTIYFSTDISAPAYKDDAGVVHSLTGAAGAAGAQGPIGPSVIHEDIIYPDDIMVALQSSSSSGSSGSPWETIATSTPSGVATVNFTGLAAYTDLRVIVSAMTFAVASRPQLQVSIDNGSNYLTTGGDYLGISGAGTPSNLSVLDFMDSNLTTSRNGEIFLEGINLSGVPKVSRANFFNSDSFNLRFVVGSLLPVTAVRVTATQNFTGGTIYVLGRR